MLFSNIQHKEQNNSYDFPDNFNFNANIPIDPENKIDMAIKIEDMVLEQYKKLPEFMNMNSFLEEHPELKMDSNDLAK